MPEPIFIDTGFIIALINKRDSHYQEAQHLASKVEHHPFITTDAVLLEIGNALAKNFKKQAIDVIKHFNTSPNVTIIHLNALLFNKALQLYDKYQDKTWGLIDCISFTVMQDMGIKHCLTFDKHFLQAGFDILTHNLN